MPFKGSDMWESFEMHLAGFTVKPYGKILVGVDHTNASAVVLQRAIQMAKAFSAKLIVVHVVSTIHPLEIRQGPQVDATYLEFMKAAGADVIESAMKKLAETHVDGEVIQAEGIPSKEILAIVEEKGVDLLIVGSKEKVGSLAHLGSVSKALSESAKCSLLIERTCERCWGIQSVKKKHLETLFKYFHHSNQQQVKQRDEQVFKELGLPPEECRRPLGTPQAPHRERDQSYWPAEPEAGHGRREVGDQGQAATGQGRRLTGQARQVKSAHGGQRARAG